MVYVLQPIAQPIPMVQFLNPTPPRLSKLYSQVLVLIKSLKGVCQILDGFRRGCRSNFYATCIGDVKAWTAGV